MAGKDQRDFRNQRDRNEIGQRTIERLVREQLRVGVGCDGAEKGDVAVRLGLGDALAADRAAAAANVFDHDPLAQDRADAVSHDAGEYVDRPARSSRNHHAHRPVRPILCVRRPPDAEQCHQSQHRETTHHTVLHRVIHHMRVS